MTDAEVELAKARLEVEDWKERYRRRANAGNDQVKRRDRHIDELYSFIYLLVILGHWRKR